MLPSPVFSGALKAGVVVVGEIPRNDCEEVYASYFACLGGRSVVFEREGVPSGVAAYDSEILIDGVNHVRIAVVLRWPTQDHRDLLSLLEGRLHCASGEEMTNQTYDRRLTIRILS